MIEKEVLGGAYTRTDRYVIKNASFSLLGL